ADVEGAGVFARALENAGAFGGEKFERFARVLVGAVFAPHDAEDAKFGVGWLAPEELDDLLVFVGLEAVLGDDGRAVWRRGKHGCGVSFGQNASGFAGDGRRGGPRGTRGRNPKTMS